MFIREVGAYIWNKIPLDKDSWNHVPDAQKNAMYEHLKVNELLKFIL